MKDPTMDRTAQYIALEPTGERDSLGNPIMVRAEPVDVHPCAWQPAGTSEVTNAQNQTTEIVTFAGPYDFAGKPTGRMILDGEEYAITSAIQRVYDPVLAHTVFQLTKVEG